MKKTITKCLLVSFFLFFALSYSTAQTFLDDGIYYNITSETDLTVEVIAPTTGNYTYYSGSVTIPESVEYGSATYTVTSIADNAFYWSNSLEEVTIPNTVTNIGGYAFYDCYSLATVNMGNSVETIGDEAFAYCFALKTITLPNTLKSLGYAVFHESTALTEITVAEGCENYCSDESGVLFNGDKTSLIQYPANSKLTSYDIPNTVETIEDYAFYWSDRLKEVNMGSDVRSIGNWAFYYCTGINAIDLPETLTYIGEEAFYYCKSLESVVIPDLVTSISYGTFSTCKGLTSVKIGNSVTSIGDEAFGWCESLKSVEIGSGVESIGDDAFYNCTSMESYVVSEDNLYYSSDEYGVFFNKDKTTLIQYPVGSPLLSYDIPETVEYLESYSFYNCANLTTVGIPTSVTSLGYEVFCACTALQSVVFPNSLTRIEESTFWQCTALESVEIPASVTTIGDYAFAYCSSLKQITSLNPEPPVCDDTDVFFDVDKNTCVLSVPLNASDAYAAAEVWEDFMNIEEISETGINSIAVDGQTRIANRYTIDGKQVNDMHKGINILRYTDGTTKKVMKK
ncbi:MAG: leucine-rich repeat domain-containing protein [Prevotella sp.]|nr:leucine-rich repeat domain-containing protein [Prevotella sp.]